MHPVSKNKILRIVLLLLVICSNISCDQVTKKVARQELQYMKRVPVVDNFISFIWVENPGAFLSLGDTWPVLLKVIVLVLLPVASIIAVLFYLLKRRRVSFASLIGFGCIIGGGIGNLYDRIVYGRVTDFLHLDFRVFQTSVFNMADVSIMVGCAVILFQMIARAKNKPLPVS